MMQGKAALTEDNFAQVANELKARRKPAAAPISWPFVTFMIILALVCTGLGAWQMQRLGEKQALIASVQERVSLDAVALPPLDEWVALDPDVYDFRPVKLTGEFVPGNTVLVFTSLSNPKGAREGAGYWVMTPFALEEGGTIIVNRGFVPQATKSLFDESEDAIALPQGKIRVTGLARVSEKVNTFTPGPVLAERVEYVRSIERMSAMMDDKLAPFAAFYVDQAASGPDVLPQGGETKLSFPNRHLEYAITWFALAAVTLLMTLGWLWRQRRQ